MIQLRRITELKVTDDFNKKWNHIKALIYIFEHGI